MDLSPITELRRVSGLLRQLHDAVSFGLRVQGDCGIEFEWKIAGLDLDPDVGFELSFTAICLDPRMTRLELTGSEDGAELTQDDVDRVNSSLQAFGMKVTATAVDEVRRRIQQTSDPVTRISLTIATTDLWSYTLPDDENSRKPRGANWRT